MAPQPSTGIFARLSYFPLAFLYGLCTPIVVIDGTMYRARWGSCFFDVPAGRHSVKIFFNYLFWPECGANSIEVMVTEGKVTEIEYTMPIFVFERGRMRVLPHRNAAS